MTNDIIVPILKQIQSDQTDLKNGQLDIKTELDGLKQDMNLQFTALNGRLSGQFIGEIALNKKVDDLTERLRKVEKQLDIVQ